MATIVKIKDSGEIKAKESYQTIRRRLLDGQGYIELTVKDKRILLNKSAVLGAKPE